MKIIILSGDNKKYNEIWNEKITDALNESFKEIESIHYNHWDDLQEDVIDIDAELERLSKLIINTQEEYIICAKTIGVLVALKGIHEKMLNPKRCIFIGMPVIWARLNNFPIDTWLTNHKTIETLIIQKEGDPAMYFNELEDYIEKRRLNNVKLIKISGDDMYYEDYDILPTIIKTFISTHFEKE